VKISFYQGVVMVIASGILWGSSGVVGQYLFNHYHADPSWLIEIRQIVAGLLFLLYLVARGQSVIGIWKKPEDVKDELLFAFGGLLGAQYGYYTTVDISNAATACVLQYTAPVLVFLWGVYKARRLPEGREFLACFLALAGVFLISTHGKLDTLVISEKALFWGMVSSISLAVYTIVPVRLMKCYSTTLAMGWGQLLTGLFLSTIFSPFEWGGTGADWGAAACVAYIIIFGTVIPFSLFLNGVIVIGPTRASLISCSEPLSSVILMVTFLGGNVQLLDYIGMGFIILTVIMLSLQRN